MTRNIILKFRLIACLLFITGISFSQVTITDLTKTKEDDFVLSFPLIHHAKKNVAEKINLHLQKDILENEAVISDSMRVFKNAEFIMDDSLYQTGLTYISHQAELNTPTALSLSFMMEHMAAYPESIPKYFNFNLETGEQFQIGQLLSQEGQKFVSKIVRDARKKLIEEQVDALSPELDTDELKYVKETFRECNKTIELTEFYLNINGIRFYKHYCFPHVARAYDSSLDVFISYSQLSKFLTPLGKRIVSEIK